MPVGAFQVNPTLNPLRVTRDSTVPSACMPPRPGVEPPMVRISSLPKGLLPAALPAELAQSYVPGGTLFTVIVVAALLVSEIARLDKPDEEFRDEGVVETVSPGAVLATQLNVTELPLVVNRNPTGGVRLLTSAPTCSIAGPTRIGQLSAPANGLLPPARHAQVVVMGARLPLVAAPAVEPAARVPVGAVGIDRVQAAMTSPSPRTFSATAVRNQLPREGMFPPINERIRRHFQPTPRARR